VLAATRVNPALIYDTMRLQPSHIPYGSIMAKRAKRIIRRKPKPVVIRIGTIDDDPDKEKKEKEKKR